FGATGDPAPLLAFVDAHLSPSNQLPASSNRSDVVHDLLAFLAEQMIAMNKAKQIEVRGFLAWLAREIGAPIDALNNKTTLQNYLGDYQKGESHATLEDLLAVLRQNRRKLTVDPSARAFQERLQAEHAASLAKLLPLKARLAATDRLIDQAVYTLYGLTDDEIAIVEGR
ncbi:MAG: restriction endonuclease, partial [Anaerolineae bacterium]